MTPERRQQLRDCISIDPETGTVVVNGHVTYKALMSEGELLKIPGSRRNSHLNDVSWYWAASIETSKGLVQCTPLCKNRRLYALRLNVGPYSKLPSVHEFHREVVEASMGEPSEYMTGPEKNYDGQPAPIRSFPVWKTAWGEVSAEYAGYEDHCRIRVSYNT